MTTTQVKLITKISFGPNFLKHLVGTTDNLIISTDISDPNAEISFLVEVREIELNGSINWIAIVDQSFDMTPYNLLWIDGSTQRLTSCNATCPIIKHEREFIIHAIEEFLDLV